MINDITIFNIREYLSTENNKKLGEEELLDLLSEFSCTIVKFIRRKKR